MDILASTSFGLQLDSFKNPENPFVTNARKIFNFSLTDLPFLIICKFITLFFCLLVDTECSVNHVLSLILQLFHILSPNNNELFAVLFPFLIPICEKLGMQTISKEGTNYFTKLLKNLIKDRKNEKQVGQSSCRACQLFY